MLNFAGLALNFQTDAAGTVDKIALLNHEYVNALKRIDPSRAMMNQITAQRPRRAARRRVFANVLADEEPRMRARVADFNRLARERVATGGIRFREIAAFINLFEHRHVWPAMPQISQSANWHQQHRIAR